MRQKPFENISPFVFSFFIILMNFSCFAGEDAYKKFYRHLEQYCQSSTAFRSSDYFIVILVDAKHLDYTSTQGFLRSFTKHPKSCCKRGDVGHAWVYLEGFVDGSRVCVEGGHSGELGERCPRYFDGLVEAIIRNEKNPIAYLHQTLPDGYFEKGNGGHRPTLAAKIDLNKDQFDKILDFIVSYNYREYSITKKQCASFVGKIAEFAGVPVETSVVLPIQKTVRLCGQRVTLWQDPFYQTIAVSSPDILEKSLLERISQGKAQNVRRWYLKTRYKRQSQEALPETISQFSRRYQRHLLCY